MPLTVTDQIAHDPHLTRLDGVLARDLDDRRRAPWQGRRGDGAIRLELLQTRNYLVRMIHDAWSHGTGTITAEEGAGERARSLRSRARAQCERDRRLGRSRAADRVRWRSEAALAVPESLHA